MKRRARQRPVIEDRAGYRLVRSRRRTCGLEVTHEGRLVVRVPLGLDEGLIEILLKKHRRWIENKQRVRAETPSAGPPVLLGDGGSLPFLGQSYAVRYAEGEGAGATVRLEGGFFVFTGDRQRLSDLFRAWCLRQAREILPQRVRLFGPLAGVTTSPVRITDARKRWGSCGVSGTLNFTWRLVMAPPDVIDYVVVHELAHLREQNHSRRFWRHVELMLPDFEARRRRLREMEHSLLAL